MKHATLRTAVVAAVAVASCAPAYATDCHQVAGRHVETVVVPFASPNDPLGRVVGQADGTINGVATAILTSVTPGPSGPPAWNATTRHVFVVNAQDQIAATGTA